MSDQTVWAICAECGRHIFRHYAWSHEGGTPPLDHEAEPLDSSEEVQRRVALWLLEFHGDVNDSQIGMPEDYNEYADALLTIVSGRTE